MYLRYELEPHFLNEKFTIDRPVATVQQSDDFVKNAMKTQGKGKTYSGFKLLDISKQKIVKLYKKLSKEQTPRIVDEKSRKGLRPGR